MTIKCDDCLKRFEKQDSLRRHRNRTHNSHHDDVCEDIARVFESSGEDDVETERGIEIPEHDDRRQKQRRTDVLVRSRNPPLVAEVKTTSHNIYEIKRQLGDYQIAGFQILLVVPDEWLQGEVTAGARTQLEACSEKGAVATFTETESGYSYSTLDGCDDIDLCDIVEGSVE